MHRIRTLASALILALSVSLPAAAADEPPAVGLRLIADGLTSPVALVDAPDGTDRLFLVDQIGLIRIIMSDGSLATTPFLDLRSRLVALMPDFDERGLLGLAFHPNYASNGRFFVYYSAPLRPGAPAGFDVTSTIAEFRVSADPNRADPASERILLQIDKPQFNHNGGTVAFGPADGYLYISIGDGGGADDVGLGHVEDWYATNAGGNGQDVVQNLLGSILRIDVNGAVPYAIPADNPFVGRAGLDEIWAYGLRNPYRFSFDMGGSHSMLAGDAGQELWEEVSLVTAGGNYGWNVKEGTHCFSTASPSEALAECPSQDPDGVPLIDPILEYPHPENAPADGPEDIAGVSVIGGIVYRGSALPGLVGRYVFGPSRRRTVASSWPRRPRTRAAPGPWPRSPSMRSPASWACRCCHSARTRRESSTCSCPERAVQRAIRVRCIASCLDARPSCGSRAAAKPPVSRARQRLASAMAARGGVSPTLTRETLARRTAPRLLTAAAGPT
jgi:glucose/arabinose dehydrogenase